MSRSKSPVNPVSALKSQQNQTFYGGCFEFEQQAISSVLEFENRPSSRTAWKAVREEGQINERAIERTG